MEIERKYLIDQLPRDIDRYEKTHIIQAYISTDPVIRLRRKDHSCILTVKSAGLLAREEFELPVSESSFRHLMEKTEGTVIEKTRWLIPDGSLTIELDVFERDYSGFMMAEVEFPSVEEADSYDPPAWFGPEVTGDPAFYNSALSSRNEEEIRRFMTSLLPDRLQNVKNI